MASKIMAGLRGLIVDCRFVERVLPLLKREQQRVPAAAKRR